MSDVVSEEDYKKALLIIQAFKTQAPPPAPLTIPNYKKLKEYTERYIELLKEGKIGNDDFKEEIFVTAMESIFGDEVWDWVKTHIKIDSEERGTGLAHFGH